MKKLILMFFSLLLTTSVAFSGGIVTNYNQSAAYIRMFVRDATTEIDAVFYNPAGLTKLEDGWHFSFSAQNLTQTREVNSTFPYLNNADYEGDAKVPIFPSFYTAYKTGKFAFSFGFNPVGGGGTATFNNGLPTMEIPVSTLVPKLASLGVSGYSAQMKFKGYSVYFGFQGGVSYEINESLSVFAGMRYVMASTTYEGYMRDIEVTTPGGVMRADDFMNGVAAQATGGAILMADQEADVKQTGSGITPILGANISLLDEDLNIGIKYEFQTEIELENETAPDKGFAIGLNPNTRAKIEMFPDGAKTDADMPALLSIGFEYKLTDLLKFSAGYHTYFDGNTGWSDTDNGSKIDKNSIEFAAGLEYKISDKLLISGGYLRTATGANALYMSDITHALNSNSGSIGGAYNISDNFKINFGVAYTKYETTTYDKTYDLSGTSVAYKESYGRDNFTVAVGVDFSIFK